MVNKLIDNKVPVKGLVVFFIVSLVLLWSYFVWDYMNRVLIFASPHDRHVAVLGVLCSASTMALLFLTAMVGAWFYIYHDAGQRGMNQWLWTLIAIFTPNLLGIIIYLVIRRPLLMECPGCQAKIAPRMVFCPHCGRPFRRRCSACGAMIQQGYQFCGSCGANLSATGNETA
ncbi:MAG TPA: zinc ribbon domain-containing protein [Acidobacteriota bacterium]|nr:zinc ribbon domain-containing protein [Acidobacteriota bacterium]